MCETITDVAVWREASLSGRLELVRRLLLQLSGELVNIDPYGKALACADLTLDAAILHIGGEAGFIRDLLATKEVLDAAPEAAASLQPGDVVVDGVVRHEPKLPEAEARAIVRGACKAVSTSELARPVEPVGSHLRELARAIDGMGGEAGDGH